MSFVGLEIAYSRRGFLSGSITSPEDLYEDDRRSGQERFQGEDFKKNLELIKTAKEIANEKNVTPSQIALAWVLQLGKDIVPIPGATNPHHLKDNIESAEIDLSDDEINRLEAVFPLDAAAGNRYNEGMMSQLNH